MDFPTYLCSNGQIFGGDFAKLCGLLRIYELFYPQPKDRLETNVPL